MTDTRVDHVTCLGCGCGCDDVAVTVREGRIIQIAPPCPVGQAWFGDGAVPWAVLRGGSPSTVAEAIPEAAGMLARARGRVLVYIGADLSTQAQRNAVMVADLLLATVDTATSGTAAGGLLAAQRRGRATATLGEVRNRADVVVFWGADPAPGYPRFQSRYAPGPAGTQIPGGRSGRLVISVNVGADHGPSDADLSLHLDPAEEIAALSVMRAAVSGRVPPSERAQPLKDALDLTARLTQARYAVLIHDAEPGAEPRNPLRVEGLIALTQALNGPTRAALISLRAGGNRPGAEAVLTWQTGFPLAVDHSRGYPRFAPQDRGLGRLQRGGFAAALVVGRATFDDETVAALGQVDTVAIGAGASRGFPARVAIDTGVAGIHEEGTAYRMDEVPLSLRPPLTAQRLAADTLQALADTLRRGRGRS